MAPPNLFTRIAGAFNGARLDEIPQSPGPIRQGSPEDERKPADTGGNMFTRAYDGFAMGAAWLQQIAKNADTILEREGTPDLKLFDALLDDDVAFSAFQQRQLALVARPWVVEPGDADDPRSVQAADDLRAMLAEVDLDHITLGMLFGRWYGYAVGEVIYSVRQIDGRSVIWIDDIIVPDRKWFAFTNAGELRMRTPTDTNGLTVPANKFWSYRVGATHDFAPYGTGLAHWCYWPIWFKRNVLQFWALYLEKYGLPTVVGYFQPGTSDEKIRDLVEGLKAIGSDSAVALPAPPTSPTGTGVDLRPTLMEATRSGGADSYRDMVEAQNEAITRVILSQTMTSKAAAGGIGSNQADVHKDVRDEVVKADGDGLYGSFNRTVAKWVTLWNHGPDVKPPTVYRNLDDEEDLDTVAERDGKLDGLGWQRTDESFKETYGDGYERKPEPEPIAPGKLGPDGKPIPAAANDDAPADRKVARFAANDPAPLYISRKLINSAELLKWAKEQGFEVLEPAEDLHVTVLYSRRAVDWFEMDAGGWSEGRLTVGEGGARKVEPMGDGGAVALVFGSLDLKWRHDGLVERGASHDFEGYLPHVTFTYDAGTVDLDQVEPYVGKLVFGPEIFEAIDDDRQPASLSFSADQLDAIDALTADLVADSDTEFVAMGEALRDRIAAFTANGTTLTPEALRVAALQAWEQFPIERLAQRMALPFAAEHAGAAAGVEDDVTS